MEDQNKYFFNEYAKFWCKGNVLFACHHEVETVNLDIARTMLQTRLSLSNGIPHFIYVDCRCVRYWTKEARKFSLTEENNQLILGGALVYTSSYAANIIINFYLKFNTPPFPSKFCNSEKEAVEWLSKQKHYKAEDFITLP
jgi:hypothetical protein